MIVRSSGNTVYAVIAPSQVARFESKPNAYMSALRDTVIHHSHTTELTRKGVEMTQKGQHFAAVVHNLTAWYHPPRGHHIDVYA